jgi:hypothetical protein
MRMRRTWSPPHSCHVPLVPGGEPGGQPSEGGGALFDPTACVGPVFLLGAGGGAAPPFFTVPLGRGGGGLLLGTRLLGGGLGWWRPGSSFTATSGSSAETPGVALF